MIKKHKKIFYFIGSMVAIYLLIAFTTLKIDFRLWSIEVRLMYSMFAPMMSMLTCLDI